MLGFPRTLTLASSASPAAVPGGVDTCSVVVDEPDADVAARNAICAASAPAGATATAWTARTTATIRLPTCRLSRRGLAWGGRESGVVAICVFTWEGLGVCRGSVPVRTDFDDTAPNARTGKALTKLMYNYGIGVRSGRSLVVKTCRDPYFESDA